MTSGEDSDVTAIHPVARAKILWGLSALSTAVDQTNLVSEGWYSGILHDTKFAVVTRLWSYWYEISSTLKILKCSFLAPHRHTGVTEAHLYALKTYRNIIRICQKDLNSWLELQRRIYFNYRKTDCLSSLHLRWTGGDLPFQFCIFVFTQRMDTVVRSHISTLQHAATVGLVDIDQFLL